jgi:serralysin
MVGGKGADVLNGGSGADSFVFTSLKDGGDRIVNFSVDQGDTVDISSVIGHPDLTGQQMVDQGFLKMADAGHGVSLLVDADGGGDHFGHLATLGGTSMASLGYDFVV